MHNQQAYQQCMDNLNESARQLKKLGGVEGAYKSGILYGIMAGMLHLEAFHDDLSGKTAMVNEMKESQDQSEPLNGRGQADLIPGLDVNVRGEAL